MTMMVMLTMMTMGDDNDIKMKMKQLPLVGELYYYGGSFPISISQKDKKDSLTSMMARMIIILKNEYVEKDVFLIMKESFATNITSFPINSQSLEDGFTLQKYSVKNTVWKNTLWTNTVLKRHFGKITVQRPRHSGNLKGTDGPTY